MKFNKAINEFLEIQKSYQIIGRIIKVLENPCLNKIVQLQKAIIFCKEKLATLIISELITLTSNRSFVNILLNFDINFYC